MDTPQHHVPRNTGWSRHGYSLRGWASDIIGCLAYAGLGVAAMALIPGMISLWQQDGATLGTLAFKIAISGLSTFVVGILAFMVIEG